MRNRPPAVRASPRQIRLPAALALTALSLFAQPTPAQQPAPAQDLQRIGAEANALLLSMPSFTCDETATSEALHNGKVERHVALSGTVRTIRHPDGRMAETNDYKRERVFFVIPKIPPLFVSGGFATALGYFLPGKQACFTYTESAGRIDFASRPDAPAGCREHGLKGFALLNAQGNVRHIERTLPPDVAVPLKLATFASIDLAPVELNGQTYQLSNHMIAEMPLSTAKDNWDTTGHFEATYSNCHRFTSTVTLGASSEIPPDASPNLQ